MKRRNFIQHSLLTAAAFSIPDFIMAGTSKNNSFLKIIPNVSSPQFDFFAIDSLGKNQLQTDIVLHDGAAIKQAFLSSTKNNKTAYRFSSQAKNEAAVWEITLKNNYFQLISNYHPQNNQAFAFNISHHTNHATLLGKLEGGDGYISLPAVLHFPDMGTLRVTSNIANAKLHCSSERFIEHSYVKILFPAATESSKQISYHFEVVTIHPHVQGIEQDARFDCFRRNFISILQLNPFLKILANNTASDACAFTLYKYAEVAAHMPPLAKGLTANDLIRMTLDRYLGGTKGYGMLGYDYGKEWDIPESATSCNSLDSYPSLLIAACTYSLSANDKKWFTDNYNKIKDWATKMLSMDADDDGLLEFCLTGNSGSWKGDKTQRPANWWDTIGFGHKDAYSNALAYHALDLLRKANSQFDAPDEADFYKQKADRLKAIYTTTFLNPKTQVLSGWKSADGELHDYYFTFVSGVAITYGLIEPTLANSIMDALFAKMKAVGYTNFEFGLPGNLIPVIRADYTDLLLEVGGGKREDNLDGFQIYENGGATACFTYFFIKALQILRRKQDADAILLPLLKSMSEGNFQGRCANGRTKDWKTWSGECWGYEGFLVDNYMFLLSVMDS